MQERECAYRCAVWAPATSLHRLTTPIPGWDPPVLQLSSGSCKPMYTSRAEGAPNRRVRSLGELNHFPAERKGSRLKESESKNQTCVRLLMIRPIAGHPRRPKGRASHAEDGGDA